MQFNKGQYQAIMQRGASILVSAPAGSGKTRILVHRIIELLKEGHDIREFLVLTFTEAAGHEMKQRLTEELNSLMTSSLDDELRQHLQKQVLYLPYAYITNFHGFCNLLLMKYGYLVDVMPGFTINSDPYLIKKEVMHECLEKWVLDEKLQDFFALYFPGYSFESLENLLLSIDELSHSIDHFYPFVDNIHHLFYQSFNESIESWPIYTLITSMLAYEAILSMNKLIELKVYCEDHHIFDFYERPTDQNEKNQLLTIPFEAYYDYLDERIHALQKPITYDTLIQLLKAPLEKSYRMNWKDFDPQIKKAFNQKKNDILSSYQKAISSYIEEDIDSFKEKMNISYQAIDQLLSKNQLLYQFQEAYQLRKKELNQLDFSDLETYAHQLLEPQYGIIQRLYHSLHEIMVDEYQDTNQIQESLLQKISQYQDPHIPLFMVGDMKQSIYRFRQADPQIFLNKYLTFSLNEEESQKTKTRRIDLIYNYRSSKIVLDSINYIFNQIMDQRIGGLDYYLDESARLNYDYKDKDNQRQLFFNDSHLATELLIDIYDPQSSLDKDQYEAHMVAQKIMKLKKELKLHNQSISYKDIVVLMRSTVSFLTFKKVFDQYHIPNHIVLSQGLMSSHEIINMMSFLKAINNPYDDISLMSVLTQPYRCSYIDMETIAKQRINHKDMSLYESILLSSDEKIKSFLEIFEELREYSHTHSPYDLIRHIDQVSDYRLFVSQLINGQQRKENLDLFFEIIQQTQETTPYLPDLIYTLENTSDFAPAQSIAQNDVVEFMTIHKSKGLEFPIVFVCQTHKQFNMQDSKERMLIDKQLGIALKPRLYHDQMIVEYENSYRQVIARHQLDQSINEEMRILYVALTRASQKLIMTGVLKSLEEIADIQQQLIVNESPDIYHHIEAGHTILYEKLRKSHNYLTWILSAILRHPHIIKQCLEIPILQERAFKLQNYHFDDLLQHDFTEHAMFSLELTDDQSIEKQIPKRKKESQVINNEKQINYENYQYPYDLEKKETLAVTKLQELDDDHYIHTITDEQPVISATDKGTLVHLLMSALSFQDDCIDDLINQLYQENLCDQIGYSILKEYQPYIQGFIDSSYYQMISQADYIEKEKSFAYYDEQRDQIIHGIFDLVFSYHGQIYVLDYKTDRVSQHSSKQNLIEKHQTQLQYYQKVLQDMYNQKIKAIVYYFHIHKGVEF